MSTIVIEKNNSYRVLGAYDSENGTTVTNNTHLSDGIGNALVIALEKGGSVLEDTINRILPSESITFESGLDANNVVVLNISSTSTKLDVNTDLQVTIS
jgi:hypothetical protein